MVKSLRKRPRPDALKTEQRRVTNRTGRLVYLALLIMLLMGGLNFLFGDMIFLRADGLVLRDKTTISATYLARVERVDVTPGQDVNSSAPILRLHSTDILERLADLSAKKAELAVKAAEFRIRSATASSLLPFAKTREHESAKMLDKLSSLAGSQIVSVARYNDALRTRFEARQSFIEIEAENNALRDELEAVDAAREDAVKALERLRTSYAEGIVRAPADGAIGNMVPSVGDVYRPGETILEVYSGDAYVFAYLPTRYLFGIKTGTKVRVKSGRLSASGVISEILPVTAVLPKEFQNSFKPRDRNQLARITFGQKPPFPLHAKVSLTIDNGLF